MTRAGVTRPRPEPLLERDREMEMLAGLVDAAAGGASRVVLIEGPAGIGKTRLLSEMRRLAAERDVRILSARGGELERDFPFGVVRQALEPLVASPAGREARLAGAAAGAATVFDPLAMGDEELDDSSFSALHGLYWLVADLASEGPLLLAIDDLHWCDRPSLRFVSYLTRRLEGLPVLIAATVRSTDPGTDPVLLGEIGADPNTVPLRLSALTGAAVNELVRTRLGGEPGEAFGRACHEATGGNPLLLGQLLGGLEADGVSPDDPSADLVREIGPRAVSRTVRLRLDRLPRQAGDFARALAVLGDGAALGDVMTLAGLEDLTAADATGALTAAEILRPEPPLGFVHPLVRDVVYNDIPAGERELRHAEAAEVLRAAGAEPERVAVHLLAIPPRGEEWAGRLLEDAGLAALRRGAPDGAVKHLRRALDEPLAEEHRVRILWELGMTEAHTDGEASARHLRAAYAELTDPLRRGTAAYALARSLLFTTSPVEAAEVAEEALLELPRDLEDLQMALASMVHITRFFGAGDERSLATLEEFRGGHLGSGPGARMLTAVTAYDWARAGGPLAECVALANESLEGGTLLNAENGFMVVAPLVVLTVADDPRAEEIWQTIFADAHRRGSLFAIAATRLWHGFTLMWRGELEGAERSLRATREHFDSWGYIPSAHTYPDAFLAKVLVERGDLDGARAALAHTKELVPGSDSARFHLSAQSLLHIAEGRPAEALEVAERLRDSVRRGVNPAWVPWRSLTARALDLLERREEALELAREDLEVARGWGAPSTVGRALRLLGLAEREEGIPRLEEAVAVLEGSNNKLEYAKALAALGGAMRRARRPADAREPLRRALEQAEACGAGGLANTARSELYASGARPRRTALSGVESLTASERRVADLAAEGHSNREIAQTLYVTPKTVEVHLSNAYRKLDIRSRRELPRVLAPAGAASES